MINRFLVPKTVFVSLLVGLALIATLAVASMQSDYVLRKADYQVPAVTLRDSLDQPVSFAELLAQPRPVLLQFIFTSCSAICPVLSATFSQAQSELTQIRDDYLMLSISIDPEYDTPSRLRNYAQRFDAGFDWLFLTGSRQAIRRVITAFDALYDSDNKMYHQPYTFLRASPDASWVRIDGFPSAEDLVREYRKALGEAVAPEG